ncbi:autophagy-related protein 8C-like [Rosa rugosa]|uniref:autophagy-related protein 8C-like n=1 Tax=Rosa rugosa TaxID=74645 RepID=UPI002B413605|nr:autophagy-related protein 8C-like [Rosa rugosa]
MLRQASETFISGNGHTKGDFKRRHSLGPRRAEVVRIREKYPDRIPVIVEKAIFTDIPNIAKNKFLIPPDISLGQFAYVIRKTIHLKADKAIFVFVNNTLPRTSALMSEIYAENADEDGFLYVVYSGEGAFGSL